MWKRMPCADGEDGDEGEEVDGGPSVGASADVRVGAEQQATSSSETPLLPSSTQPPSQIQAEAEAEAETAYRPKGYNHIHIHTDAANAPSRRLLARAGFTLWRENKDDFVSDILGLRSTVVYRLPRPGTVLGVAPVDAAAAAAAAGRS